MNNKETKGLFCFPFKKLSLVAYVISQEQSANQQKQLRNGVFHVKTSLFANSKLDPAKNENWPKKKKTI